MPYCWGPARQAIEGIRADVKNFGCSIDGTNTDQLLKDASAVVAKSMTSRFEWKVMKQLFPTNANFGIIDTISDFRESRPTLSRLAIRFY